MTTRLKLVFIASLIVATSLTYVLTRAYYKSPVVRFSRQIVIHADDTTWTINSPFRKDDLKSEIISRLSAIVGENPPTLDSPGIYLDTWIWICRNGEQIRGQHTNRLFLRRVGNGSFQFWDCREYKFDEPDWFPVEGHTPGSIDSCVDYYWREHLGDLVRDFDIDWYVANPDKFDA